MKITDEYVERLVVLQQSKEGLTETEYNECRADCLQDLVSFPRPPVVVHRILLSLSFAGLACFALSVWWRNTPTIILGLGVSAATLITWASIQCSFAAKRRLTKLDRSQIIEEFARARLISHEEEQALRSQLEALFEKKISDRPGRTSRSS